VLTLLVPVVAADFSSVGVATTDGTIDGSGDGIIMQAGAFLRCNVRSLDAAPATFATAARLEVTEVTKETAALRAAGKDLYSDSSGGRRVVGVFNDATLAVSALHGTGDLRIVPNGTLDSRAAAAEHFWIHTPDQPSKEDHAVATDPWDPEFRFYTIPEGYVEVSQRVGQLAGTGAFTLQLKDMQFSVGSGSQRASFDARARPPLVPNDNVSQRNGTYYLVEAVGGSYDTNGLSGRCSSFSKTLDLDLRGSLVVPSANGEATSPDGPRAFSDERLDLNGRLHGSITSAPGTKNGVRLEFRQESAPIGHAESTSRASMGGPQWILPLSVVGALGLCGVAAATWSPLRHRLGVLPALAPVPTVPSPPAPLVAMEAAFRADAGNVQGALELGLEYVKAGEHEKALPLLLMSVRNFPKSDVARYACALAFLHAHRDEEAVRHLDYAFRLNPLNVARFIKEGPAHRHGRKPQVEALLRRWARVYHESNARGYA
jgi:hypothetical protein